MDKKIRKVKVKPLTKDNFKQYGEVITAEGEYKIINQGNGKKWNDLINFDIFEDGGKVNLGILRTKYLEPLFNQLGLIYPPGSYADIEELIEICKVVAEYDGIMMVHMRNEQDKILKSLDEMIRVVKESKVRLHISHLKALGSANWGKVREALHKIEEINKEGLETNFGQYPYDAFCTGLKVIVPAWAYEGGEKAFQRRLNIMFLYFYKKN